MKKNNKGFTILEMSVCFVIVAFLVVGVFKGQELVQAYKIQVTVKEYQQYLTAFKSFQAKYAYLPGDFPAATRIWPDLSKPGSISFTGDGDGNGVIDNGNFKYGGIQWYTWFIEGVYAWAQLSREGLIPGSFQVPTTRCYDPSGHCSEEGGGYSGNKNTGYYVTAGENAPYASLPAGVATCDVALSSDFDVNLACRGKPMWMAKTLQLIGKDDPNYVAGNEWTQIFNTFIITSDFRYYGQNGMHAFYPTPCGSARVLDTKIDDGKPFTGRIVSEWGCRENRAGCQYSGCYTGKPSDWNYVPENDPDNMTPSTTNFIIGDTEI